MNVSVIIPLFNEIAVLPKLRQHLPKFGFAEIIFVDGGSSDGSWQWLKHSDNLQKLQFKCIQTELGRAGQMNAGMAVAKGDMLLFLHADSRLPTNAMQELARAVNQGYQWGRFDIEFVEQDWRMSVVAFFINLRSWLTGVATGDQGIFVSRDLFEKAGAYANIPLMEDVELCKRLRQYSKPYCSKLKIETSARRWLTNGLFKTVLQMWWFRFAYFIGVSSEILATRYKNIR